MLELMRGKIVVDIGTVKEPKPVLVPVGASTRLAANLGVLDRLRQTASGCGDRWKGRRSNCHGEQRV